MDVHITSKQAAFATLVYADIFEYPLTRFERETWSLFFPKPVSCSALYQRKGFFFLKGRAQLVAIRSARQQWQPEKWAIARRVAGWLALFPTIQLVGVTGGLSMNNAKEEDDVDIFLIVAGGTIWITRLLVVIFMSILGVRRKPLEKNVSGKVCFNMFVTPRGMGVSDGEQDCFAAHEVLQMQPLWEQKGTYKKFLLANEWVQKYLPNAWNMRLGESVQTACHTPGLVVWVFRLFDFPAKLVQLCYMQRHLSSEVVTDSVLRFHPKDARVWVKREFRERLAALKIPLDKVFYAR